MPLSGAVLGAAVAAAVGMTDVLGPIKSGSLFGAFCSWLVANAVVTNVPPTMVAAGSAVTGTGQLTLGASDISLRDAICSALGVTDIPGLAVWLLFSTAWVNHITLQGLANPTAFVANPVGGPVTGVGTFSFASPMVPPLATQMGMAGLNIAQWALVEAQITAHLVGFMQINSLGFTSPTGGGPLVGASTIL